MILVCGDFAPFDEIGCKSALILAQSKLKSAISEKTSAVLHLDPLILPFFKK
jgi:hypothetical protein